MDKDEAYRAKVQAVVDLAPPLTDEQCATISRIMYPPGWSIVPPQPDQPETTPQAGS